MASPPAPEEVGCFYSSTLVGFTSLFAIV